MTAPASHLDPMVPTQIFVVDPRRTETAKAGEHVFIRPDTDVFFYLAFLRELIQQGGVDRRAVGADQQRRLAARVEREDPAHDEPELRDRRVAEHQARLRRGERHRRPVEDRGERDEQQQLLQWKHMNFSYNVHTVWNGYGVPLHPGAEKYYKEIGLLK